MNTNQIVQDRAIDSAELRVAVQPLMRLVFLWMGFGLLVTGMVSWLTAHSEALVGLLQNGYLLYGVFAIELILVGVLSARIGRLSLGAAALMFTVYAALNGFTLGLIFLVFSASSVTVAFVTTVALFAVMAVTGYVTKIDLTRYSTYLFMGLIGLLIAMLVNLALGSSTMDFVISIIGVIVFCALTAHDTQKIKQIAADPAVTASSDLTLKLSIIGALVLYLDFINLFLFFLNMSGNGDE
jgi:uncharacterized protein